jgi:hypothetical protein
MSERRERPSESDIDRGNHTDGRGSRVSREQPEVARAAGRIAVGHAMTPSAADTDERVRRGKGLGRTALDRPQRDRSDRSR